MYKSYSLYIKLNATELNKQQLLLTNYFFVKNEQKSIEQVHKTN